MRLFIGIPISDDMRQEALRIQHALEMAGADYKWVEGENLHYTIHFFGETPAEKVDEICQVMRSVAGVRNRWEIALGAVGAFGSIGSPRVLWMGLSRGGQEMSALAEGLFAQLAEKGFRIEKREFSSHLTLGRMRSQRNLSGLRKLLERADTKLSPRRVSMPVRVMNLYESRLSSSGPKYNVVREIGFAELRENNEHVV